MQLKLRFHISFSDVNATAIWIAHLHQRQQTGVTADDFGDDFSKMVTTRHGSNRLVRLNDAFMTDQSVYSPPTPRRPFLQCVSISAGSRCYLLSYSSLLLSLFFLRLTLRYYSPVFHEHHPHSLSDCAVISSSHSPGSMEKMQNSSVFTLGGLQRWRFNTAWIIKPQGPVTDTETHSH